MPVPKKKAAPKKAATEDRHAPGYYQDYYERNKDAIRLSKREYYLRNRDRIIEESKANARGKKPATREIPTPRPPRVKRYVIVDGRIYFNSKLGFSLPELRDALKALRDSQPEKAARKSKPVLKLKSQRRVG